MTFVELIKKVFREEKVPLSSNEIWKIIVDKKYEDLVDTDADDPAAVVYGTLYGEVSNKVGSDFIKTGRNEFFLRELSVDVYDEDNKSIENRDLVNDSLMCVKRNTSFEEKINVAKIIGCVTLRVFKNRLDLGGETSERDFRRLVKEIHYLELKEKDGEIELLVDKSVCCLCTAIEKHLQEMNNSCKKGSRFVFDFDLYRMQVQKLYDLVRKGSKHKTKK